VVAQALAKAATSLAIFQISIEDPLQGIASSLEEI